MTGLAKLKRTLERLEKRYAAEDEYRTPRYLDRYFKELENIRRREAGLEPLPYTEEDQEDDRRFLVETIPAYRAEPGWQTKEAQALLDAWEQKIREKLGEDT